MSSKGEVTHYDSVTGIPLFIAPRGRSFEEFDAESKAHGWPSFRDDEMIVCDNVGCRMPQERRNSFVNGNTPWP